MALIPVFFFVSFGVQEVIYALTGYDSSPGTAPLWVNLAAGLPGLAILLIPCIACVVYGRRATRTCVRAGLVPEVLAALVGVAAVVLTAVNLSLPTHSGAGSPGLVRRPEELANDEDCRQQPNQSRDSDQNGALIVSEDGVPRSDPGTDGPGSHHQTEDREQPVVAEGLTAGLPTGYGRHHGGKSGSGDAEESQRQPTRSGRRPDGVRRVSPMLGAHTLVVGPRPRPNEGTKVLQIFPPTRPSDGGCPVAGHCLETFTARSGSSARLAGRRPRGEFALVGLEPGGSSYPGMIATASISTSAPGRACPAVETTVMAVR